MVKKLNTVNYLIRKNDRSEAFTVHVDKLKACMEPTEIMANINHVNYVYRASRKDWFNCGMCGRNTLGRHAFQMHVERCKKTQKSLEVVPPQHSCVANNGHTENMQIPEVNEYVNVGNLHGSGFDSTNAPSTSAQVRQILDASDMITW